MGYSTDFTGVIRIKDFSIEHAQKLAKFLGKDIRELNPRPSVDFYHIDLKIDEHYQGLEWDGSEKTYGMMEALAFLASECGFEYVSGDRFVCQGERIEDRYYIEIDNLGLPQKINLEVKGIVECPSCGEKFTP